MNFLALAMKIPVPGKKKKTLKNRVKDTYIGILKEKEKKHGQTR